MLFAGPPEILTQAGRKKSMESRLLCGGEHPYKNATLLS